MKFRVELEIGNRFHSGLDQWDKGFHAGYNMINKFVKHLQETIEVLRKRKHYWRNIIELKNE